jgi:hypothetical protein
MTELGLYCFVLSSKERGPVAESVSIPLRAAHTHLFILFITEPTPHVLVSSRATGALAAGSCHVLLKQSRLVKFSVKIMPLELIPTAI